MKNLFGTSHLYSIAIYLPSNTIALAGILKNKLANEIGWYNSKNSAAHISIISFNTDEYGIETVKKFLKDFAGSQLPFNVTFNKTGILGKAFCLFPDERSNTELTQFIKNFHITSPKFSGKSSYKPHISIGRNLREKELEIASRLIRSVDLKFEVDNISLRKFNYTKGQFEMEEKFTLNV